MLRGFSWAWATSPDGYNVDASESYWIYGLPSFPSPGFNANFYF